MRPRRPRSSRSPPDENRREALEARRGSLLRPGERRRQQEAAIRLTLVNAAIRVEPDGARLNHRAHDVALRLHPPKLRQEPEDAVCAPGAVADVGQLRVEAQIRFERGAGQVAGALDVGVAGGVLLRSLRAALRDEEHAGNLPRDAQRENGDRLARAPIDADFAASQRLRRLRSRSRLFDRAARGSQACRYERAQTRVEDLHRHIELLLHHVEQGPRRLGKVEGLGHRRHGRSAHALLRA